MAASCRAWRADGAPVGCCVGAGRAGLAQHSARGLGKRAQGTWLAGSLLRLALVEALGAECACRCAGGRRELPGGTCGALDRALQGRVHSLWAEGAGRGSVGGKGSRRACNARLHPAGWRIVSRRAAEAAALVLQRRVVARGTVHAVVVDCPVARLGDVLACCAVGAAAAYGVVLAAARGADVLPLGTFGQAGRSCLPVLGGSAPDGKVRSCLQRGAGRALHAGCCCCIVASPAGA